MNRIRENAEQYMETLKGSRTANTILSYRQDLFQYCDYLEEHCASVAVSVQDVVNYVDSMNTAMAPASVARKMSVLNGFFKYLVAAGEIADNPIKGIKPPRIPVKTVKRTNGEDVAKLISVPKGYSAKAVRDRAMLAVMSETGYKASRMISLELEDYAELQLSGETRRILIDYIYGSRQEFVKKDDCNKIFVNYNGGALTRQGFWKIVKSYKERK